MSKAAYNLAANELQDRTIGRFAKGARTITKNPYWRRPVGPQSGAVDVVKDRMFISVNTIYYLRLVHVAGSTTATLYVYSDAAYTTLVDTLVITDAAVATKFRYLNATASHNQGTTYKASGVIYQTGVLSPAI